MNLIKPLILLIALNFLLLVASSAIATDNEVTIQDERGDVYVITEESADIADFDNLPTTNEKPNIDIKEATYQKAVGSKQVTLTLDVYGLIENAGDLDDPLSSINFISYSFELITTLNGEEVSYQIIYVNQKCILTRDMTDDENVTGFTNNNERLSIPFDLSDAAETYKSLSTETTEFDLSSSNPGYYMDISPNTFPLSVTAGYSYEGVAGENIELSGTAMGGTKPYVSYQWDFGDGSTSNEQNSTHAYAAAGEYNATLTVTDNAGLTEIDIATVTIIENNNNGNHNDGESDFPFFFIAVIVIIVIIGTAIVIYILRR
ncbi:MAG: PKD domain-containing protein [Euryarchaeota archaeon]|nr:PKD domain-containing protein [Euryarchaeota archaeon]